ncbi:MAG: hypothetical protein H7039_11705 [Bryobacteraceae bacterium]|nr:hypothetical protein [Bryobacteraceae bacterium]
MRNRYTVKGSMRYADRLVSTLLATAALCSGQQLASEEHRARQLLSSPVIVDQAWGIYLAGRLHLPALNEKLVDLLGSFRTYISSETGSAEAGLVLTLFDALIENRARMSPTALLPYAQRWRDEVLILLAMQNPEEDLLMRLRQDPQGALQTRAWNNLLLRIRSGRLFVDLLKNISIQHTFLLVDEEGAGFAGGGGRGCNGCGIVMMPRDFPPVTLYRLTGGGEGRTVFIRGPVDSFYSRTTIPTNQQAGSSVAGCEPITQQEKLMYLADLAGATVDDTKRTFEPVTSIVWAGRVAAEQTMKIHLANQDQLIRSFIGQSRKSLRGDYVIDGLNLRLTPFVDDRRRSAVVPPPELQPVQVTLP